MRFYTAQLQQVLTAHRIYDDHSGVNGAAQCDHGSHGDGGVVGTEGAQNAEVPWAVSQLAEDEFANLWIKKKFIRISHLND